MSRIDKKTVNWCCKVIRRDAFRNAKNDDPDLGFLPATIRLNKRITKSFFNIPKKDLHNKNKRAVFLMNAMECTDNMLHKFNDYWHYMPTAETYYRDDEVD